MFENILEISFSVSIVIIILFALTKFFDKNYTVKWRYFVWLVLAIRLILPINLSLENAPLKFALPESFIENTVLIENGMEERIEEKPIENSYSEIDASNIGNLQNVNDFGINETTRNMPPKLKIFDLLKCIYMVGFIAFVTYHMIVYLVFKKNISSSSFEIKKQSVLTLFSNVKKEIGINKKLTLQLNTKLKSPMIVGLIKPILLLNNLEYGKDDMEMILRHEIVHIKRRDIWYKALLLFARAVHWFNPLVHLMARKAYGDIELSCDAEVVKLGDNEYKRRYSEAIIAAIHNEKRLNPVFSTNFNGGKNMLKKRFKNIFDSRKKRKGNIAILVIILLLSTLGLCISCTQDIEKGNKNIIYSNKNLGFELVFPEDWKERYVIEESDNNINVYSKKIKDNAEFSGQLFSIVRLIGELITEEDIAQSPVPERIIQKGNGYTFILRKPSDMQYSPENEEMINEYKSMEKDVMNIGEGISLIGNNRPETRYDGFKVVGSSFFTAEILDSWQIESVDDSVMTWEIKENNHYIGRISFVPYFTDTENERICLHNEELLRKVEIEFDNEYVDKTVLDKITSSFKILGGHFTSVDMETAAQQYIKVGGKTVFGMIEKVNIEEGNPISILIKEKEFLHDDDAPNGFRIETLSEVPVEYPVSWINVLPLAPPDYNSYKIYYMPDIKDFIENYDYEYYYYNFIVGSDGEIKMILGRYVP